VEDGSKSDSKAFGRLLCSRPKAKRIKGSKKLTKSAFKAVNRKLCCRPKAIRIKGSKKLTMKPPKEKAKGIKLISGTQCYNPNIFIYIFFAEMVPYSYGLGIVFVIANVVLMTASNYVVVVRSP
jgi:hypothetical protein